MIVRVTTQNHIFVYRVLFYFFLSTFIGMLFEDLFKKFPAFLLCSSLKKSFKKIGQKLKKMLFQFAVNPFSRCSTTRSVYSKYNILHYLSHTKLLERLYGKKLQSENNLSKKIGKGTEKNSYTGICKPVICKYEFRM